MGAAFATMELHEVLRAVVRRFALAPDRPEASGCAGAASR